MWHSKIAMTDDGCEFNAVHQLIVKELGLKLRGEGPSAVNFDSHHMRIYSVVDIVVKVKDSIGQIQRSKETFLSVQEAPEDFVLGLPFLMRHDPD